MPLLKGIVLGEQCELRFAFAGKIVWVSKKCGDTVKKGEAIASLDKKFLQAELDRQLADYEKTRAEFELHILKFGKEPGNDEEKYQRQIRQAQLNASVKDVELSKFKLDQVTLISPVDGTITHMNNFFPGIYITPSSHPVQILPSGQRYIECFVPHKFLKYVETPKALTLKYSRQSFVATSSALIWDNASKVAIRFYPDASMNLQLGDEVTVELS